MSNFLRRSLLTVLLGLGLMAFCSPRVLAQTDMMCQGDMTSIASLAQCVQHAYDMSFIDNAGVLTSLEADLSAAQAALNRGQPTVATLALQAFIHEVSALSGVHIDPAHADHMIMHAAMIIAAL